MTRVALIYPNGTTTVGGVLCQLVPVEIVADAIVSLGAFVSDEGWSQGDMDNFDRLCAFKIDLSALPELPKHERPICT